MPFRSGDDHEAARVHYSLGSAAAWPLTAHAQQPERIRRVGVLTGLAENDPEIKARLAGFRQGLEKFGWSEGSNVRIDYRFAPAGAQVQSLARELVALQPDVILAQSTPATIAVQAESRTIPIVFVGVADPIGSGLVASLPRPGGNLTGLLLYEEGITGKWLAMLKEIAPNLTRAALVANPKTTPFDYFLRSAEALAPSLAIEVAPKPSRTVPTFNAQSSVCKRANRRTCSATGYHDRRSSRSRHCTSGPVSLARGLRDPCFRRSRWSHVLWDRLRRLASAGGGLR